jgi:hypothetical protein
LPFDRIVLRHVSSPANGLLEVCGRAHFALPV